MKILSISDVITNSSSEVFVIHAKSEFQNEINEEIPNLIEELCKTVGLDMSEIIEFHTADKSEIDPDWYYHVAKNDLVIESIDDNTIPYWLIQFIEELYSSPKLRYKFSGYYATDLGEVNMPYYDYESPEQLKHKLTKIESIQRVHLG